MEYNEKKFAASANKKTMGMWLAMLVVLSIAYALEIKKGLKTPGYFLLMELIAWVPFVIGLVAIKVQVGTLNCIMTLLVWGMVYFIFTLW